MADQQDTPGSDQFHAGYAAVVGLPNAGKSTLLNNLLAFKVSIVTRKPQTTRHNVTGILNGEGYQIVFIDTPGIIKPRYDLQTKMMRYLKSAMSDADVLIYLIDVSGRRQSARAVRDQLANVNKPVILALNKIDTLHRKLLLPMIAEYSQVYAFHAVVLISALKSDGLDRLTEEIRSVLPKSPPYYPTDYISDQQERFFVAEMIREKIFQNFGQEVPYSTHVEIEDFKELQNEKDYITAVIYVERDSQKSIIIGKGGAALKQIGQQARVDIEQFLDRPVFLELFVKVASDWRKKEDMLKRLGY